MQQMQQSIAPTPGTRNGPDRPRFEQEAWRFLADLRIAVY
jgi:hypothetical protein